MAQTPSWLRKLLKRPAARVTLTPFSETDIVEREDFVCDGWIARGVSSLAQLLTEMRNLQLSHPDHRLLTTLDDFGQAAYTAMHAVHSIGLKEVSRSDAPGAPDSWFEGEPTGFAEGMDAFPYRLSNLHAEAASVSLAACADVLPFADPDLPHNDPISINTDPDAFLMLEREKEIYIQAVPAQRAADAIGALPNGYFTSDLSPMQNYALATALEERHGLALFGIGASTLGFWREAPLGADDAVAVSHLIGAIYSDKPANSDANLAEVLLGKREVFVRYTES